MNTMRNPKNIKQEIKIWWKFYIMDIGILAAVFLLANRLVEIIPLSNIGTIAFYMLFGVFGLFLCIHPFGSPTNRNLTVIWNMLKMDNKNYHPIEVRAINSVTKRN